MIGVCPGCLARGTSHLGMQLEQFQARVLIVRVSVRYYDWLDPKGDFLPDC
jgi:hypothetical protein